MFQRNQLFQTLKPGETIHKPALLSLLREQYPDARPATLDWRIYDLVQQGLLIRRGRGLYQIVPDKGSKALLVPNVPDELGQCAKKLKASFPLLACCVWSTALLYPFMQQQPFITYWLIETEREGVNSVLDYLQTNQGRSSTKKAFPSGSAVMLASDISLAERYQPDAQTLILIKPLISEVPLQQTEAGFTVPTAEKILVDLLADNDVFNLFGEELPNLFEQINAQYILNYDRMRRYARRRHKLPDLDNHLARLSK
ncbi:DUF6577 family protein [uncultured Fibrella sp.]|uniref:DUF6577 family protein n=1 Tax=uncultured Fibrella sp. TaxID=1284596 RepID=UPI0035CB3F6B